jgi:hypothetical protein
LPNKFFQKKYRKAVSIQFGAAFLILQFLHNSLSNSKEQVTSTFRPVLQYSLSSTLVLSRKYWSTAKEVLAGDENHLGK